MKTNAWVINLYCSSRTAKKLSGKFKIYMPRATQK